MQTTFSVCLNNVLVKRNILTFEHTNKEVKSSSFILYRLKRHHRKDREERKTSMTREKALPDPTGSCNDQGQGSRHYDDAAHDWEDIHENGERQKMLQRFVGLHRRHNLPRLSSLDCGATGGFVKKLLLLLYLTGRPGCFPAVRPHDAVRTPLMAVMEWGRANQQQRTVSVSGQNQRKLAVSPGTSPEALTESLQTRSPF